MVNVNVISIQRDRRKDNEETKIHEDRQTDQHKLISYM